jgi:hypothetical protein
MDKLKYKHFIRLKQWFNKLKLFIFFEIHFQFILRYCHHFCCVVVTLWFTSPKLTRPVVIKLGENVHGNVLYKYMYVNSNNKNPLQKQEALRYQKIMLIHPIICQFKKITMSLWGFWLQTVWSKEYKKFYVFVEDIPMNILPKFNYNGSS